MRKKYIDAEKVNDLLDELCVTDGIFDAIQRLSAADVAEVRHAKWSKGQVGYQTQSDKNYYTYHFGFKCSNCGGIYNKTDYCGGCGARMNAEKEE